MVLLQLQSRYNRNMNGNHTKYILLIIFFAGLGISASFVWRNFNTTEQHQRTTLNQSIFSLNNIRDDTSDTSNTSDPFANLTIPYLQERTYESSLGDLREIGRNSEYVSYLTSYDSDGLTIQGLLTEPTGKMPQEGWPAIVFIHGYIPPDEYRTLEKYESYVDYLARNGFVVFKIDLRGHGESEGEPSGTYFSTDYIVDTLNARAALHQQPNINQKKIGLWGHSMAGNIVFRSMVAKQNIPAGVIWAGAVYTYQDMQEFGIADGTYQPPSSGEARQEYRNALRKAHGQFDPEDTFWKQVAPTNYLDDFSGKLQIHHAVNDPVVSIEYSRNLSKLLDNAGISHSLYEYQSGGHNLTSPTFTQAMQRTVDFFTQM